MARDATVGEYEFTPGLGFGTAGIFHEPSKTARRRLLDAALDAGIRHFDVAPIYGLGLAEDEVGRAIRGRRGQVVLATKVGIGLTPLAKVLGRIQSPARKLLRKVPSLQSQARTKAASPSSGQFGRLLYENTLDSKAAKRSLEQSLRQLHSDYIDLLLLHDPLPSYPSYEAVYDLLEAARVTGKIRAWGVAGEFEPTEAVISKLPEAPAVVQVRDDIFQEPLLRSDTLHAKFRITFGALGDALPTVLGHVKESAERTRRWSDTVGADCSDDLVIVNLLLKDAIHANPEGILLYSTTRPERIRDAVAVLSAGLEHSDASLDAFRQLVREELNGGNTTSGVEH